jgi:hypothetical protein
MTLDPVPRSLVAVDIEGYSRRDNLGHLELREGLKRVCDQAFEQIRVTPESWQDQGDAFLILVPPEITKALLVDDLVRELVTALRLFNRNRLEQARMRLRVALHAGEVHPDGTGFGGASVVTVMRLIDADDLRESLKAAPKNLAVVVSEQLHRDVVLPGYRGIDPGEYQEVKITQKEFCQPAWIRVPGAPTAASRPSDAATGPATPRGVLFTGPTTFQGTTSIAGHAAGRDMYIRGGAGD